VRCLGALMAGVFCYANKPARKGRSMSQSEKTLFRVGRFIVAFALGLWMWILLPIVAWYVKRIPDRTKNLPFSGWLRTNMLQDKNGEYVFYDWLSGFLWGWWGGSVVLTVVISIIFAILVAMATLFLPFTLALVSSPIRIAMILYLISVVSFGYIGFDIAKSNNWDYLIWQAEPAARALLGQEYDRLTEEQKKELHRHIADVEAGINKGTWVIIDGKAELRHVPADSFARFGGPGGLVVPEGYVVVTQRSGRIARTVGAGYYQLAQYERPQMVVYLPARAERVTVNNALTRDKMVITSLELMVFHRADRGNQSGVSGHYHYDEKLILEKIWSPKGSDWRDTVKSVSDSAARDVIAEYNFEDLVSISDEARRKLLGELVERINKVTKDFLGVDVIAANMGAITISDEAKKVLEAKNLAEAKRLTLTTQTEGEAAALITRARAEREKLLMEADANRLTKLADAEVEYRSIVTKAEAEKQKRIAQGEAEKEFLSRQGEGKAFATREEGYAKAESEVEKIRQFLVALAQLPIDDMQKSRLIQSLVQGDQYRDLMGLSAVMSRRFGIPLSSEAATTSGENAGENERKSD
jgi:regulator of protease activity HflC (stomatin/prohibitin superfamily)